MTADHFRLMLVYNRWANEKVLACAVRVPKADYFAMAPGLSFGSLHATLVHTLVAELVWLARWQRGLPPDELKDARQASRLAETEITSLAQVQSMWQEQ